MKKVFMVLLFLPFSLSAEEAMLKNYYNQNLHGNMMANIITADMKILDSENIEFNVNTPGGIKKHYYNYKVIEKTENLLVTEWYENGQLNKRVSFYDFNSDGFTIDLKGKGKVKMQRK